MFGNSNVCLRAVVVTVIMVCMHLSMPSAYAQRTMNGQSMITVSAVSSMIFQWLKITFCFIAE